MRLKSICSRIVCIFVVIIFTPISGKSETSQTVNVEEASKLMTDEIILALNQIKDGSLELEYISSSIFGDGGSSGENYELSNGKRLVIFIPYSDKESSNNIRLWLEHQDDTSEHGESLPLGESPDLKQALISMLEKKIQESKWGFLSDDETTSSLRMINKIVKGDDSVWKPSYYIIILVSFIIIGHFWNRRNTNHS